MEYVNKKSLQELQKLNRNVKRKEENNKKNLLNLKCELSKNNGGLSVWTTLFDTKYGSTTRTTIEGLATDKYRVIDVLEEKTDEKLVYQFLSQFRILYSHIFLIPVDVINIITRFYILIGKITVSLFNKYNNSYIYQNKYHDVIRLLHGDKSISNLQSTMFCKIPPRKLDDNKNESNEYRELSY
jgi:hypothetical protein